MKLFDGTSPRPPLHYCLTYLLRAQKEFHVLMMSFSSTSLATRNTYMSVENSTLEQLCLGRRLSSEAQRRAYDGRLVPTTKIVISIPTIKTTVETTIEITTSTTDVQENSILLISALLQTTRTLSLSRSSQKFETHKRAGTCQATI